MNSCTSFIFFLAVISTGLCLPRIHKRDATDDAYWTDVVYSLVRDLAEEILKDRSSMAMDDFSDNFGGKLLDGKIKATGGSIGNFSTLSFVNLTVSTTPNSITVFLQVKLDQLEISYSNFDASVRILSVSGGFKAVVAKNLLTAQVTLYLDGDDCKAVLEILELTEFGGVDLAISGVDFVSEGFVNKMANMVVNKFLPELKPLAEGKVRDLMLPYMSQACDYWV